MSGHKVCKERNRNCFAVIEVIEPIKIDVLNTCLNVFHRWRAVLHWLVSVKKHDCVTRIAAETIVRYLYVETWDLIGPFNIAPYRFDSIESERERYSYEKAMSNLWCIACIDCSTYAYQHNHTQMKPQFNEYTINWYANIKLNHHIRQNYLHRIVIEFI